MMKEKQIVYENGDFWVGDIDNCFTVFIVGITHSKSDSSYEKSEDGLSIAKARCDYLANKSEAKKKL